MKKIISRFISAATALCCLVGSSAISVYASNAKIYEAEDATLSGVTTATDSSASGGKYVSFESSGSCTFSVTVSSNGFYDIAVCSSGVGGVKSNKILADGEDAGSFSSKSGEYSYDTVSNVYLTKGTHKIAVTTDWGWIKLDCIKVSTAAQASKNFYNVDSTLINPNATQAAKNLMSFICENYGKKVISGQNCDNGLNGAEFSAIKKLTGKTPAILGMDLMRYTPTRVSKGDSCKTVENAIEFSNEGGIVELHWHWNAPDKYLKSGNDEDGNPRWWGGFYTKNVDMDLSEIMNGGDEEGYELLMADIDAIAVQLKKLSDADVPVLFRPLHEASGGWFWWGSDGADSYKKLWYVLYDKLTNEYGLNNLIWVWNGQDKAWYPGDDYVDIIGEDIYPGTHVYNPQSSTFLSAANYTSSSKVVAMTENGCLFDVDKAISAGTVWSWFCTWSGEFAVSGSSISTKYTSSEMWKSVYQNENVITLDDLSKAGWSHTHTYKISTVKPTYSEQGYILHKCTSCGYSYKTEYTAKKTLGQVKIKSYTSSESAVKFSWSKVTGATGYRVYRYDSNTKKFVKIATIKNRSTLSYKDTKLKSEKNYQYKVKAYVKENAKVIWGSASKAIATATKPSAIKFISVKKSDKEIKLSWSKTTCTGYRLQQYNTKSKKWVTIKTLPSTTTKYKISGLKKNTSYKFRIQAYKSAGSTKIYSKWSSVKTVKTSK